MSNLDAAKKAVAVLTPQELNDLLPFYNQMLRNGRAMAAAVAVMELKAGDEVVLHNIRPQHMNGAKGEVISIKRTKAFVKFPNTQWQYGVNVPASCLTKVN